jgi:ABC-type branched-subunit amino acid transport system ATPase component
VNLRVMRGSFVGLIGPNGSGKTTMFNIVSGYLRPAAGRVRLDGQDIVDVSVEKRSALGLVRTFQTPQVFGNMTVLENVMTGCYKVTAGDFVSSMLRLPRRGRDLSLMRSEAHRMCERFGFGADLDSPAATLPAGRRRLLELARACVAKPSLLLLDEPSSGLNSSEIQTLIRWLHDIHASGISLLLVSHHMELMEAVNHVHVLDFGRIIGEGSLAQVKAMPQVQKAYLGTEAAAPALAANEDSAEPSGGGRHAAG